MNVAAVTPIAIVFSAIVCLVSYGYLRERRAVGMAVLICGLGLIWGGWGMANGWRPLASEPDREIALKSSQWRCEESHMTSSTMLMPVGKVLVPMVTSQRVCDRYARR